MRRGQLRTMPRDELEDLVFFYEDVLGVGGDGERAVKLAKAFNLSRGPAWLLARMVAADPRVVPKAALLDYVPTSEVTRDRGLKILDVYMVRLRRSLGADAFETCWGVGWRLTPLGRLRTKRVLDPEGLET